MARARALAAALAVALLVAVPSAGGSPEQTPTRGGTVVLAQASREPACLNAFFARCRAAGGLAEWVMRTVLPGAYQIGPGLELRPNLVSRVDVTKRPPFTLTYRIRPEARWSDGTPVSARDFVFTHRTSLAAGDEFDEAAMAGLAQIASVRALDARTVRVVLRSRFGRWRGLFPAVLPQHALAGAAFGSVWNDRIHDPATGRPIGSGPFLVQGWTRGRELVLVRNPRYWGVRSARLDRLVLRFFTSIEESIEGLRRGELDLVHGLALSVGEARAVRQLGVSVQSVPGPAWEHLELRVRPPGHPALRNPLVRRAIAHAIDRTALVRTVVSDADRRDTASDNTVFSPTSRHYRPNWNGLRYDAHESARLLRQAGCRLGADRVYVCPEGRLSLRAFTVAGIAFREEGLRIVSEQLRRAGIEVVPAFVPFASLNGQILLSGAFDLVLFSWVSQDAEPGMNFLRCGDVQNYTGYCQRLVTRDIDEAARVLDADQRARVFNRADARVASDVPVLPLYQRPLIGAARATLRGYAPSGSFNPLLGAENWWLAQAR